mgnify:CR=1 FL=1
MSKLKDKIVNHAKTEYSSSPYEFGDEHIQLIIDHDCECDHCGKSIFELDDFPYVSIERKFSAKIAMMKNIEQRALSAKNHVR